MRDLLPRKAPGLKGPPAPRAWGAHKGIYLISRTIDTHPAIKTPGRSLSLADPSPGKASCSLRPRSPRQVTITPTVPGEQLQNRSGHVPGQPAENMQTAAGSRLHAPWARRSGLGGRRAPGAPPPPPGRRSGDRLEGLGVRRSGAGEGPQGRGRARRGLGCGRPRASPPGIFPPARSLAGTHLPITSHSSYTSSNSTSSSAMVRGGQRPQRGGLRKRGWGRPRAQCPAPGSPPPLGTREPSVLRTLERGGEARGLRRLPLRATAPARRGRRGRERGRPGPGAARPPAAPRAARAALPGVRLLGDRAAPRSALRPPPVRPARGREAASAPSARPAPARRGAALPLGGAGAAAGPRRDARRSGRRWRRQLRAGDQEAAAETLPPPPPPAAARRGVGGGGAGLAGRAGGSRGRRLRLLPLRRRGRGPARRPRAPARLPLRPRGLGPRRPRPLPPVGRRGPREGGRGLSGACARRPTRHGDRAGAGDRGGVGVGGRALGARGRPPLRWGPLGVVTSAPGPGRARGAGDKRSGAGRTWGAMGGGRLGAPAAPTPFLCHPRQPGPRLGWERVLMNGKSWRGGEGRGGRSGPCRAEDAFSAAVILSGKPGLGKGEGGGEPSTSKSRADQTVQDGVPPRMAISRESSSRCCPNSTDLYPAPVPAEREVRKAGTPT